MKPKQGTIIRQKLLFRTKSVDENNYTVSGTFSTGGADRDGEIIDQNGWKLDEFMLNPVVLWAHDHSIPAIGKVIELYKDGAGNLTGTIQFAAKENERAMTVFKLYAGGFLRAFSVGFMNDVYEIDNEKDQVILRENTMYEISCVNVGANAMALAFSKGININSLKGKNVDEDEEFDEDETDDDEENEVAVNRISHASEKTIRAAIKALTDALPSSTEADNQAGTKVEHSEKSDSPKKVSVKVFNAAVRALLKLRNSQ